MTGPISFRPTMPPTSPAVNTGAVTRAPAPSAPASPTPAAVPARGHSLPTGSRPIDVQSEASRVNASIAQANPSQIQARASQFSQMGLVPSGFPRLSPETLQQARQNLRPVSQHQVLNLGAVDSGSTTQESVRSRKLGSEVGGVPLDRDRLPGAQGALDIVGHSSENGMKIEGRSPQQLASLLKHQYGLQQINTIHLVSCKSEAFKAEFQQALAELGVEVGEITAPQGQVAVDRATGKMLDEAAVGDLSQIAGHDGALGLKEIEKAQATTQETIGNIGDPVNNNVHQKMVTFRTRLGQPSYSKGLENDIRIIQERHDKISAFVNAPLVPEAIARLDGPMQHLEASVQQLQGLLNAPQDKKIGDLNQAIGNLKAAQVNVLKSVNNEPGKIKITADQHEIRFTGRSGISFVGDAAHMVSSQGKTQELRHIASWNTMRDSMSRILTQAVSTQPSQLDTLEGEFNTLLGQLGVNPDLSVGDNALPVVKGRINRAISQVAGMGLQPGLVSVSTKAYALLDLMHSSPINLWSGDGPINEAIGQFKTTVAVPFTQVQKMPDEPSQAARLEDLKGGNVNKIAEAMGEREKSAVNFAQTLIGIEPTKYGALFGVTSFQDLDDHAQLGPQQKAQVVNRIVEVMDTPQTRAILEELDTEGKLPDEVKALYGAREHVNTADLKINKLQIINNVIDRVDLNPTQKASEVIDQLSYFDVDFIISDAAKDIGAQIPFPIGDIDQTTLDIQGYMKANYNFDLSAPAIKTSLASIAHPNQRIAVVGDALFRQYSPAIDGGRNLLLQNLKQSIDSDVILKQYEGLLKPFRAP